MSSIETQIVEFSHTNNDDFDDRHRLGFFILDSTQTFQINF